MQTKTFDPGWLHGHGKCGGGSNPQYCVPACLDVINFIEGLKNRNDVPFNCKVNEAGCGDMEWMRFAPNYFANIDYKGYDITNWQGPLYDRLAFQKLDITGEVMREADIIVTRLVFIHLPNIYIKQALENFKLTGAKYLIADFRHGFNDERQSEPTWEAFNYNLRAKPFSLEFLGTEESSTMGLYKLQ